MSILLVEEAGRVRVLTFNRPEARNALDTPLYTAAADALDAATADDRVAVVVLTGAGSAYCAGQDLAEMGRLSTPDPLADQAGERAEHGFSRFMGALEAFPKPLLAAVNGVAVGLGVTMLPYCDLVLAADGARFRLPFVRLGVVPEAGSSYTVPAVMGRQAAAHALLTGAWFDARTALTSGLVWRVVPSERLLAETIEVAQRIAAMPVVSLVETKRLLLATRLEPARAAREREEAVFARLIGAPANREAIAAFLEGREPDFTRLPAE